MEGRGSRVEGRRSRVEGPRSTVDGRVRACSRPLTTKPPSFRPHAPQEFEDFGEQQVERELGLLRHKVGLRPPQRGHLVESGVVVPGA